MFAKFTIGLFMFWLHTVVLSKTRKLQNTNRVNLSVFTVHLAETFWHICTVIYRFHKLNSSRHNYIMALEIRYYNANSKQRRYRICHWFPMFFGTPCIISLSAQIEQMKIIMLEIRIKACRWHAQIKVWHAYSDYSNHLKLRPPVVQYGCN